MSKHDLSFELEAGLSSEHPPHEKYPLVIDKYWSPQACKEVTTDT